MARIRTIKPDFFTSDDICILTPLARLLYIGLWCEADREGRMAWAPKTFKRRYLPDDDCDIDQICRELLARDLVRLYGDELAFIPTFLEHQHVNPREAKSTLEPPDCDAIGTRAHASNLDRHAQVGREGKEREGKEGNALDASRRAAQAQPLPEGFKPSDEDRAWAAKARPDLTPALLDAETERFCNHALANERTAHNWGPNWRNWVMRAPAAGGEAGPARRPFGKPDPQALPAGEPWDARLNGWRRDGRWMTQMWGPPPGEPGCRAPAALIGGTA